VLGELRIFGDRRDDEIHLVADSRDMLRLLAVAPFVVLACKSAEPSDAVEDAEPTIDSTAMETATVDSSAVDTSDDAAPMSDATPADGAADTSADTTSTVGPSIGAAAVKQRVYSTAPPKGTLTTSPVTTTAGSTLLASLARGTWSAAPDAPTDNHGNAFTLLGATHAYTAYPESRTGLFDALSAKGGAGHTFSMTWGDIGSTGDEVTISVVEVRGASKIVDSSWVERPKAATITSGTVTTTGPAILVAWWWGAGGVLPVGSKHVAAPGSGFTLIPDATALTSISTNGYVQVAAAYRVVSAAGMYTVTWTTSEAAQLYLVALTP
jgi:hypothetical protein